MNKVYVLYVYIYPLISNNVDRYKDDVGEHGLCFMCLLKCLLLKCLTTEKTIDEQGLFFMFIYTFLLSQPSFNPNPNLN